MAKTKKAKPVKMSLSEFNKTIPVEEPVEDIIVLPKAPIREKEEIATGKYDKKQKTTKVSLNVGIDDDY